MVIQNVPTMNSDDNHSKTTCMKIKIENKLDRFKIQMRKKRNVVNH